MSAVKTEAPAQEIFDLAREAWESSGNSENARIIMAQKIRASRSLTKLFIEHCLERACGEFIGVVISHYRTATAIPANPDRARTDGGLVSLAYGNLFDFPIWGGKRIGDCTREEVQTAAERYLTQADTMRRTGNWMRLIVANMNDNTLVKDAFTSDRLQKLKAEADNE